MAKLLVYICEKRNIDPAHHRFNLPVTEESLANKVLQDLRITSIGVLCKGKVVGAGIYILPYLDLKILGADLGGGEGSEGQDPS